MAGADKLPLVVLISGSGSNLQAIIDAAENTVITVCGFHGGISGHIRPIPPGFAVRVFTVARIVGVDKAITVDPDRLKPNRIVNGYQPANKILAE